MWQHKKQVMAASFVMVTLASVVGVQQGLAHYQDNKPLPSVDAGIPDAEKVGNVPAAMEQSRRLMGLLKEVGGDSNKLPLSARQLPDHIYSEEQAFAPSYMSSFVFIRHEAVGPLPAADPQQDDLVFYSPIYVRRNLTYYKGDKFRANPTGFFIVGLKDGSVFQVPVADVRLVKGETHKVVRVFPGMKAYDPKAWRLPYVEFADGNMSREKTAAFERDVVAACAGCAK